MLVQVFHRNADEGFVHVADVAVPDHVIDDSVNAALEYAFARTQNIEGSWSKGPDLEDGTLNMDYNSNVSVSASLPVHNGKTFGLRSSMMGDLFVIDGVKYQASAFGFEEIA